MAKTFKNVLLLYKRSAYQLYFLDSKSSMRPQNPIVVKECEAFKEAHDSHYATLRTVARTLFRHGVRFTECYRGRNIPYSAFDLVITVGGDGTFLEAARKIKHQVMLGVNSAPKYSVGRYCVANKDNFEGILKRLLAGRFKIKHFHRLRVQFDHRRQPVEALNDVLICHRNPAVLCRYGIQRGSRFEEQRSSGIWVSTPAGSTGAIHSAGGKGMDPYAKKIQYVPRELYESKGSRYRLKGGIVPAGQKIKITSLMRQGMVFLDGAHQKFPFDFGSQLMISLSSHPVKTVSLR
ncbi:MAG: NAD(+)/NADH kinase [Candidatus Omnitrophota bacterium]|jgi:NAD+ kinase|nr:NAD(+)/NADH kinase [Candidatus Omnitrophota bacterium]